MASLAEKIAEYESLTGSQDLPEAGASHYLKRGALQGISALADLVPNVYNLGKAFIGMGREAAWPARRAFGQEPLQMPTVGDPNPIAKFLLENYDTKLNERVRPSESIGGKWGAAMLEGAGAAVGQGPMGLVKAAPMLMAKELAKQEARNAALGSLAGGGAELGSEASGDSPLGALAGGLLAGVVLPSSFIKGGGVTVGGIRAAMKTAEDLKARGIPDAVSAKVEPAFSDYVGSTLKGAVAGTPNSAENLTEGLRLRSQIPGFNPSVAEMAGSPGMIDMQKKFALLNPKNLNAEVARNEANAKAIQDYYRGITPKAESPGAVRSSVNQSLADYEKLLADEARATAGKLPIGDQLDIGTKLSAAAQAEKTAAKPAIKAAYDKAFEESGNSTISGSGIISKVEEILGEKLSQIKPENTPQTVSAIKKVFGEKVGGTAKEPPSLISEIKELGGITSAEGTMRDITGESRVTKGIPVGLFHKNGRGLDELATSLRDRGYLIPEHHTDGGVQFLRDMIHDEVNGTRKHYSANDEQAVNAWLRARLDSGEKAVPTDAYLNHKDLHDIRVAINQDMTAAQRSSSPTAATRMYNLGQVLPEVDKAIAQLPGAEAYKAANAKYATEYAPRFKEGTPGQVFKDKSTGEERILPDKFVSEFFKPDASAGMTRASQFSKLFGSNPEAKDLAKNGILDIYRQKVVDPTTGAIKQSAHDAFLRDYGRTLYAYKSAGVDAASDIRRVGQEAAKVSASMDSLNSLAKLLKFDTVDALANDALRNPKTMGNTIMRLSPEKRQTFNTILLDKSFESGNAEGMMNFLSTNQKTLKMTVPPQQLSAMNDIAKALQMAERAPIRGNIAAGGADMLKNMSGISTATVFAQIRAVTGQRSSIEWAAINLAMPALNKMTQTSFANVMENALHSPQSAVALRNYLLAETPQQANQWAQQILTGIKMAGKTVWAAKGPIIKNFLGPEQYPENLARTGTAIRSQMQQDQQNQQP